MKDAQTIAVGRVTFFWKARDGSQHSIGMTYYGDMEQSREDAKLFGYPGHKGGWWNYFTSDLSNFLRNIIAGG